MHDAKEHSEKKQNPCRFSVVTPVYNSENSLQDLHKRLSKVFAGLDASWELILVNDYSKDGSWDKIKALTDSDPRVKGINLMNNFGQHNAIMCGLKYAEGEYVITIDDDLQHPPEEITKLVKTILKSDFMVVYGQYKKKNHGWFRDWCSKTVNKLLSKITGSGYTVTSFRIMHQKVVKELVKFSQYNVMIDVLIKNLVGSRSVGHCMVEHHARTVGKTNYSFGKLFSFATNMIFSFTLWPLRLASILGITFSALSILLAVFYAIYYLVYGVSVSGWTSLFITVTFVSGIILFVLGIIGEYLGRVFMNMNHTPQYVVKEELRGKSDDKL